MANVIQLEFMLIELSSLKHIYQEVDARARDNHRVKLVVRIFDRDGLLTEQIIACIELEAYSNTILEYEFNHAKKMGSWSRWWVGRKRKRAGRARNKAKEHLLLVAQAALRATIRNKGPIGIEVYPGAPFRLVRHNELHELLKQASRAVSLWAFVFTPNELLADRNTSVLSVF